MLAPVVRTVLLCIAVLAGGLAAIRLPPLLHRLGRAPEGAHWARMEVKNLHKALRCALQLLVAMAAGSWDAYCGPYVHCGGVLVSKNSRLAHLKVLEHLCWLQDRMPAQSGRGPNLVVLRWSAASVMCCLCLSCVLREARDQPLTLAAATSSTLGRQWKALALGRPTLDEYLRDQCAAYTANFSGAIHCSPSLCAG